MSPEVIAAIIAAGASVLTLIGTVVARILGFRSTHKGFDNSATFTE
jgi:hypothetical protein